MICGEGLWYWLEGFCYSCVDGTELGAVRRLMLLVFGFL